MTSKRTPLGFLPIEVELHSHGIFLYREKDESFVQALAEFLAAGIEVGEMSVCFVSDDLRDVVAKRLTCVHADPDQLRVVPASEFTDPDGSIDLVSLREFFEESTRKANGSYAGMRAFTERRLYASDRHSRHKLLETESCAGLSMPVNVLMCGYETSVFPRSHILQVKALHQFYVNTHSMRWNNRPLTVDRFLTSFYKFRSIFRSYPCNSEGLASALDQFGDMAVRSPLDLIEIGRFKSAIRDVFDELIRRLDENSGEIAGHVHVGFAAEPEEFRVVMRDHGMAAGDLSHDGGGEGPGAELSADPSEIRKTTALNDDGDLVITLVKRYEYLLWRWLDAMQAIKPPEK